MNRIVIPLMLVVGIILLFVIQCALIHRWYFWGVRLELLPALLLYVAFTVNLPTSLLLALLSAMMYDTFSGGNFGSSIIPYIAGIFLFCAIRPIFFRNRITTQFVSGFVLGFIVLLLQWMLCGKWVIAWEYVWPKLIRLSLISGVLAVAYFIVLDAICRFMGFDPGRLEETL